MKVVLSVLVLIATSQAFARGWKCVDADGRTRVASLETGQSPTLSATVYINDPKICEALGRRCVYAETARGIYVGYVTLEGGESGKTGLRFFVNGDGAFVQSGHRFVESNRLQFVPDGKSVRLPTDSCHYYGN